MICESCRWGIATRRGTYCAKMTLVGHLVGGNSPIPVRNTSGECTGWRPVRTEAEAVDELVAKFLRIDGLARAVGGDLTAEAVLKILDE